MIMRGLCQITERRKNEGALRHNPAFRSAVVAVAVKYGQGLLTYRRNLGPLDGTESPSAVMASGVRIFERTANGGARGSVTIEIQNEIQTETVIIGIYLYPQKNQPGGSYNVRVIRPRDPRCRSIKSVNSVSGLREAAVRATRKFLGT